MSGKISILLVMSVLVAGVASRVVSPAEALPEISVRNPLTGDGSFVFTAMTTSVGFRFNATLNINSGIDVFAWQVRINYNSTLLNATRAWAVSATDPDYIFYGLRTIHPPTVLAGGSVLMGVTLFTDAGVSFAAQKKLGTIEFEIIKEPPQVAGSRVSSELNISNADTFLLDSRIKDIISARTNGYYRFDAYVFDLNGDKKVDIRDIAQAGLAFGSYPGYPSWNVLADFNQDGKVDIRDLVLIAKNFGKTYSGEITILDDRFDTGLDNWVYWGGPGYVVEWVSNAAKISGDHNWPPLVDCGMQKVVDLSAWGEQETLLLSFDWRATSSYSSSCTTNARLWIQDADTNSSLLFLNLISGGTLDTGWQAYSSDISSYVTGHSNIRIILYLMDNYAPNYDQTNFYDNIKLKTATSP